MNIRSLWLIVASLALSICTSGTAAAQAQFFAGKQIKIVCSTAPGAVYDTYSRLLAKHMGNHIPGHPSIIVQNMPGAGGIKATNYAFSSAPRDGTVIVGPHSGVPIAPMTRPGAAQFDVNRLGWIGSITKDPFVAYVWHTSPVKSLEAATRHELIVGGTGAGTASVDIARVAAGVLHLKLKLVPGYKSAPAVRLAMERGEIAGAFGNSYHGLKTTSEKWLSEGKVIIIAQLGMKKHPDLPNVPLLIDFAKTQADRQALIFELAVREEAAKPYLAPPGLPKDRLAILRRAFDATMKDPQFVNDARSASLTVDEPLTGAELTSLVQQVSATPKKVIQRVLALLKQ